MVASSVLNLVEHRDDHRGCDERIRNWHIQRFWLKDRLTPTKVEKVDGALGVLRALVGSKD